MASTLNKEICNAQFFHHSKKFLGHTDLDKYFKYIYSDLY